MYKKWRSIIIFVSVVFFVFKIDSSVYPEDDCNINNTSNVCLDKQYLFTIKGNYKSKPRNKIISERIKDIADDDSVDINKLRTKERKDQTTVIMLNDRVIVTLTVNDTNTSQKRQQIAEDYIKKISTAIEKYRKKEIQKNPPNEQPYVGESLKKPLWDWLDLLIVPLLLAGLAYLFQRRDKERETERAERQKALERGIAKDNLFEEGIQAYLKSMADILLNKELRNKLFTGDNSGSSGEDNNYSPVSNVVKILTITILRKLEGNSDCQARIVYFLRDAGLYKFIFKNANLSGINLSKVNLQEINLQKADLRHVNLQGANLQGANLQGANLQGTNLQGTNLQEAYLGEVKNLTIKQTKTACNWEEAIYKGVWNNEKKTFIANEPENTNYIKELGDLPFENPDKKKIGKTEENIMSKLDLTEEDKNKEENSKNSLKEAFVELDKNFSKLNKLNEDDYNNLFYLRNIVLGVKRLSFEKKPNKAKLLVITKELSLLIQWIEKNNSSNYIKPALTALENELDLYKRNQQGFFRYLPFIPHFNIRIRTAYSSTSLLTKIVSGLYVSGFVSLVLLVSSAILGSSLQFFSKKGLNDELISNQNAQSSSEKAISFFEQLLLSLSEEEEAVQIQQNEITIPLYFEKDTLFKEDFESQSPSFTWNNLDRSSVAQAIKTITVLKESYKTKISELETEKEEKINNQIDTFLLIIWVMTSGTLGSIISMFIRIKEYDSAPHNGGYSDSLTPILIGVFKPLIGASFALFLWALISSEIVSSKLLDTNEKGLYVFITISFVAGFSERLVQDLISDVERKFLPNDSKNNERKILPNDSKNNKTKNPFNLREQLRNFFIGKK